MWLYLGGLEQSHIAKLTPIVKKSCSQEWPMEVLTMLRSGTTLTPCKEGNLRDSSISYLVAFHARILALLEMEKAWQESEADCFTRSLGCAAKLSLNLSSWKTQTQLPQGADWGLLDRLPPSGIAVDGLLRKLERKDRHKYGKDGFVWPTPTASQASKPIRSPSPSRLKKDHGYDLQDKIGELYPNLIGKRINPQFLEWMMGYPLGWTELAPLEMP